MEDRKDSDDEKSDRNRPWWKKRFVSAIPKGKEMDALSSFIFFLFLLKLKIKCSHFKSIFYDFHLFVIFLGGVGGW